jgi:acyl carrier protein
MQKPDALQQLLIEFFDLPPDTAAQHIHQSAIPAWDSLAMVQLITELQQAFEVEFALEEIQALRSYGEIKATLVRKGISVEQTSSSR